MGIKVKKEEDVEVTESELNKFSHEYNESMKYRVGPGPTLEEFIRRKKSGELKEDRKLLKE